MDVASGPRSRHLSVCGGPLDGVFKLIFLLHIKVISQRSSHQRETSSRIDEEFSGMDHLLIFFSKVIERYMLSMRAFSLLFKFYQLCFNVYEQMK